MGMPGPRSTTRTWISSPTRPASTRTGVSSGDHANALSTRLASARSSSAGSVVTRGASRGRRQSTWPLRARSPRLAKAEGTTSSSRPPLSHVRARRRGCGSCRAGSRPARRVGRSRRRSPARTRRPHRATSRCRPQQRTDRRLDRRERRAQVVGHGGEEPGAQLVGRG